VIRQNLTEYKIWYNSSSQQPMVREQPFEMAFIHGENMVEQVSPAAFDPTVRGALLPETLKGGPHGFHFQGPNGSETSDPCLAS